MEQGCNIAIEIALLETFYCSLSLKTPGENFYCYYCIGHANTNNMAIVSFGSGESNNSPGFFFEASNNMSSTQCTLKIHLNYIFPIIDGGGGESKNRKPWQSHSSVGSEVGNNKKD